MQALEAITMLDISTCPRFTARGLEKLACLPRLEVVQFYVSACGDDVAEVLTRCPRLQEAHLERTQLTDAGLERLATSRTISATTC